MAEWIRGISKNHVLSVPVTVAIATAPEDICTDDVSFDVAVRFRVDDLSAKSICTLRFHVPVSSEDDA